MQRRFRGDVAGIWSKLEYGLQASVLFGGDVDPGARGLGSKLSKLAATGKKRLSTLGSSSSSDESDAVHP